ncbi:winged helix-turn-helix transcriptional regulator [Nocardia sienata]|uniref:winged helix-turn-helix transcriptional regulator n=1 Tax=Nocardia sienata TaxID=248552 RepID=UPI001FDFEAC4|nr:helix-turn-helix domain-containing protein [Nocardia sienata]
MSVRRTFYSCQVELAMDTIGGKWAVVILGYLKERPRRYGELRRLVPQITEKMLTQRLRELEAARLIERTVHDAAVRTVTYRLIDPGLQPVLQALYDWGGTLAARDGIDIGPPREEPAESRRSDPVG